MSFQFEEVNVVISESVSHEIVNMSGNNLYMSLYKKARFLAVGRSVLFCQDVGSNKKRGVRKRCVLSEKLGAGCNALIGKSVSISP